MIRYDQPWMIVQEKAQILAKSPASIWCDRRQHFLILYYEGNKHASLSSINSMNLSDHSNRYTCDIQIVIDLERIQYIQRCDNGHTGRSAQYSRLNSSQNQIEIYYSTDQSRSEYLYKHVAFQLFFNEKDLDRWINALYIVIDEAKNLNESSRRNRWIIREYEKLKRSSKGLTFDSIPGWLNSHIGLIGEKKNVIRLIKEHDVFTEYNEITDSIFKSVYNHFYDKQQEMLVKILMSDFIEQNKIYVKVFALRVTNNEGDVFEQEVETIVKFLRLDSDQTEVPLNQCMNYLWSDANSAFDPVSRMNINEDMNQPLNHYWISSSHNTYLAKTQLFNPASPHCYIQALLKGCRCLEIDVVDGRSGTNEPEVTHKNTRIKPIQLREVLESIHDYAFIASEYPLILSIENHCSPEQRYTMSRMFIEIFGENLLQSALSNNETRLPSPEQLKRKIILKDSKMTSSASLSAQIKADSDEQLDISSPGLVGHVQLFDFIKTIWFQYNYWFKEDDLFLEKDEEIRKRKNLTDDFSDDDLDDGSLNDDLTQIWYHGYISHQEAQSILLSNPHPEIGTFLVRKSVNKNCYCITFFASESEVKSIEMKQTHDENGKTVYSLSQKIFESVADLVSHYRTYDFIEVAGRSNKQVLYRLGRPLPRQSWQQELERQSWYQPHLTREQAEELLSDIGEEMTFLIRESSVRTRQDYTISIYTNHCVRHSPIYREGVDLMLMSKTFTSLMELVNYFSHKPIFDKLILRKAAKPYGEHLNHQNQGVNQNIMTFLPLDHHISLKVATLRTIDTDDNLTDRSVKIQLCVYEEDRKGLNGYFLKFDSSKDSKIFLTKISQVSSPGSLLHSVSDDTLSIASNLDKTPTKLSTNTAIVQQSQWCVGEYNKLIIYCQGVKLKELDINKAQDLLVKIKSFKEMISLNYVKADTFCRDPNPMIQFNQNHFTRIYPDFSRRSWNSYNFEPILYWLAGCQMVALNFQTPDRPMHINAGRFAANGGCGYILMPYYIRAFEIKQRTSAFFTIRVLAVRHIRTIQAKSILKVHVKTTLVNRNKPTENPSYTTTFTGPCGIWDAKQSSRHQDQLHAYNRFQTSEGDVDILYFDVTTDNQEFCGQSAIPLTLLRTGIRSVPLFDRFNERLDMSAILVDIVMKTVTKFK